MADLPLSGGANNRVTRFLSHGSVVEIVPALPIHVGPIGSRMGEWDRRECAASGRSPKDGLRSSLRASVLSWSALVDGRAVAMWGAAPVNVLEGIGSPWLLASDDARRHVRAFLRAGSITLPTMLACFPILENHVASGNAQAIRLLRGWGFNVGGNAVVRGGERFIPFSIGR